MSEHETKSSELKTCILLLCSTVFLFHFGYIFQSYSLLLSVAVSTEFFFHIVVLRVLKESHGVSKEIKKIIKAENSRCP